MVSFWAGALSTGNIEFQRNSTLQWGNPNEVWPQDVSSRLAIDLGVTATLDVGSQQVIFASEFASRDQGSLVVTGFQGYGSTWGSLTLSAENSFAGSVSVNQTVLTVTEPTVFEGSVNVTAPTGLAYGEGSTLALAAPATLDGGATVAGRRFRRGRPGP